MSGRSRSRSRGRDGGVSESRSEARGSESREERRRKRKTGWDVGGLGEAANPADPAAAAAIAAAAASRINSGAFAPGMATGLGFAAKPSAAPHPSMCRIYVGSLDYYLTELEIKSVFQAFGTVTSVDMPKEGDRSKGFCFVEYASPEAAQMALSTMNNFVLKGRTIKVGRPTAVGAGQPQQLLARPLGGYDMGMGMGMGMNPMGSSVSPTLSSNMSIVSSAQAGAAAATAILAGRSGQTPVAGDLAGALAAGQQAVSPEKGADPLQGSNRIYVGNVPFGFSSEDLKKIFVCFGPILNCQLLPSQENPQQHRGYGFIEFSSADAAKLAIETMNGFPVVGKQLKVNYATALRTTPGGAPLGLDFGGTEGNATVGGLNVGGTLGSSSSASAGSSTAGVLNRQPSPEPSGASAQQPSSLLLSETAGGGSGIESRGDSSTAEPSMAQSGSSESGGGPVSSSGGDASSSFVSGEKKGGFPKKPSGEPGSSAILLLTNTVSPEEVDDDLMEEMREECGRYGAVEDVKVHVLSNDVRIFVAFKEKEGASKAAPQLHGRWFGGRQIHVRFYDEKTYGAGDLAA